MRSALRPDETGRSVHDREAKDGEDKSLGLLHEFCRLTVLSLPRSLGRLTALWAAPAIAGWSLMPAIVQSCVSPRKSDTETRAFFSAYVAFARTQTLETYLHDAQHTLQHLVSTAVTDAKSTVGTDLHGTGLHGTALQNDQSCEYNEAQASMSPSLSRFSRSGEAKTGEVMSRFLADILCAFEHGFGNLRRLLLLSDLELHWKSVAPAHERRINLHTHTHTHTNPHAQSSGLASTAANGLSPLHEADSDSSSADLCREQPGLQICGADGQGLRDGISQKEIWGSFEEGSLEFAGMESGSSISPTLMESMLQPRYSDSFGTDLLISPESVSTRMGDPFVIPNLLTSPFGDLGSASLMPPTLSPPYFPGLSGADLQSSSVLEGYFEEKWQSEELRSLSPTRLQLSRPSLSHIESDSSPDALPEAVSALPQSVAHVAVAPAPLLATRRQAFVNAHSLLVHFEAVLENFMDCCNMIVASAAASSAPADGELGLDPSSRMKLKTAAIESDNALLSPLNPFNIPTERTAQTKGKLRSVYAFCRHPLPSRRGRYRDYAGDSSAKGRSKAGNRDQLGRHSHIYDSVGHGGDIKATFLYGSITLAAKPTSGRKLLDVKGTKKVVLSRANAGVALLRPDLFYCDLRLIASQIVKFRVPLSTRDLETSFDLTAVQYRLSLLLHAFASVALAASQLRIISRSTSGRAPIMVPNDASTLPVRAKGSRSIPAQDNGARTMKMDSKRSMMDTAGSTATGSMCGIVTGEESRADTHAHPTPHTHTHTRKSRSATNEVALRTAPESVAVDFDQIEDPVLPLEATEAVFFADLARVVEARANLIVLFSRSRFEPPSFDSSPPPLHSHTRAQAHRHPHAHKLTHGEIGRVTDRDVTPDERLAMLLGRTKRLENRIDEIEDWLLAMLLLMSRYLEVSNHSVPKNVGATVVPAFLPKSVSLTILRVLRKLENLVASTELPQIQARLALFSKTGTVVSTATHRQWNRRRCNRHGDYNWNQDAIDHSIQTKQRRFHCCPMSLLPSNYCQRNCRRRSEAGGLKEESCEIPNFSPLGNTSLIVTSPLSQHSSPSETFYQEKSPRCSASRWRSLRCRLGRCKGIHRIAGWGSKINGMFVRQKARKLGQLFLSSFASVNGAFARQLARDWKMQIAGQEIAGQDDVGRPGIPGRERMGQKMAGRGPHQRGLNLQGTVRTPASEMLCSVSGRSITPPLPGRSSVQGLWGENADWPAPLNEREHDTLMGAVEEGRLKFDEANCVRLSTILFRLLSKPKSTKTTSPPKNLPQPLFSSSLSPSPRAAGGQTTSDRLHSPKGTFFSIIRGRSSARPPAPLPGDLKIRPKHKHKLKSKPIEEKKDGGLKRGSGLGSGAPFRGGRKGGKKEGDHQTCLSQRLYTFLASAIRTAPSLRLIQFFLPQILRLVVADETETLHRALVARCRSSTTLTIVSLRSLQFDLGTTTRSARQLKLTNLVIDLCSLRNAAVALKEIALAAEFLRLPLLARKANVENREDVLNQKVLEIAKNQHLKIFPHQPSNTRPAPNTMGVEFPLCESVCQSVGFFKPVGRPEKLIGIASECKVLKSATRAPCLIPFTTARGGRCDLIFKMDDDLRHDGLCLQLMEVTMALLRAARSPALLNPYGVQPALADGCLGGVIERIKDARSRHDIGAALKCSLGAYFHRNFLNEPPYSLSSQPPTIDEGENCKYLHKVPITTEEARWNFLRSVAGYSLVTFLLQIKDRHNANILILGDGSQAHIDFSFILDISPARDINFERAPFKLTSEMLVLMDGASVDNAGFKLLEQIITDGYMQIRQFKSLYLSLIQSYQDQDLACFKKKTVRKLKKRLQFDKSDQKALAFIHKQIHMAVNALSTRLYDVAQSMQQGIAY